MAYTLGMGVRTPEIEAEIITGLMSGLSLVQVCQQKGMPDRTTVCRWMAADDTFATKCARAREFQAEISDDKLIEIVQKVESGELTSDQARVMSSILQWRAAKLLPKRYGDKQSVDLNNPDGKLTPHVVLYLPSNGREVDAPHTEKPSL